MKIKTIELPIDLLTDQIQLVVMKQNKKILDNYSKIINQKFKGDLQMIDKLMLVPLDLLRQGIEQALLASLNAEKKYVVKKISI